MNSSPCESCWTLASHYVAVSWCVCEHRRASTVVQGQNRRHAEPVSSCHSLRQPNHAACCDWKLARKLGLSQDPSVFLILTITDYREQFLLTFFILYNTVNREENHPELLKRLRFTDMRNRWNNLNHKTAFGYFCRNRVQLHGALHTVYPKNTDTSHFNSQKLTF